MKRLCVIVLLFCSGCAFTQNINPVFDRRNIGLAKELVGPVNVLCIFISNGEEWPTELTNNYIKYLEKAERWLTGEAATYNKSVSFTNYYLGREKTIIYATKKKWNEEDPGNIIFAAFDHNSQAAYKWFRKHPNCAVIMFTNSTEWCSAKAAFALNSDSPKHPQMELARIHNYSMQEKDLEIAHEMLHLFGAWDLYPTESFKGNWKEHINELTTDCNSIMDNVKGDITNHHVDPLNAYLIGWTTVWKDWYIDYRN